MVQDATEVFEPEVLHQCQINLRSDLYYIIVCYFVLHCFISVLLVCTLLTYIKSPLAVALLFCGSPFNLPLII